MKYESIYPNSHYPYKMFSFKGKSPNRIVPVHWHDSVELIYCMKGCLEVSFPDETFLLKPQEILLVNSNIIHSSRSPEENEVFIIQFPLEYLQEITEKAYGNFFLFDVKPGKQNENDDLLLLFLCKIYQGYQKESLADYLQVKGYSYNVLSLLCRSYQLPIISPKSIPSRRHLEKLRQINNYIEEHAQENLYLKTISEVFNYDSAYFSRFFKKYMGVSFSEHLRIVRLEKAYQQLKETDKKILDIAIDCGFGNTKSFYNVFKKYYHVSPQKYRQKINK